jgi:hypothetical protein
LVSRHHRLSPLYFWLLPPFCLCTVFAPVIPPKFIWKICAHLAAKIRRNVPYKNFFGEEEEDWQKCEK